MFRKISPALLPALAVLIMIGIGGLVLFAGAGRGSSSSGSNTQLTAQAFAQAYAGGPSGDVPSCPSLMFFGVRGSGETESGNYGGYGHTIWSLQQDMQGMVHGMQSFAIDYPAIPVPVQQVVDILFGNPLAKLFAAEQLYTYENRYNASVTAGVRQLLADYNSYESACRGSRVMFAGYSQGADVIYQAYKLLPAGQQQHVIMASFGDPHFDSFDTFVDQGSFTKGWLSILPYWWTRDGVHTFPYWDGSHVHSWCLHGDGVCNYSFGNMVEAAIPLVSPWPHYHYMDAYTADAAKWAYGVWKNLA